MGGGAVAGARAQLTLGHFQLQMWTAGLVVLTAFWCAAVDGRPGWRAGALVGAVAGGFAVAGVQLALTRELTQITGFTRDYGDLMNYPFPPGHWAQLALPGLFLGFKAGFRDPYWIRQGTTPDEASLYVGTVPLVLAFVGLIARRDRALTPWRLIAPLGFFVATLPRWWPNAYLWGLLQLPGYSHFRAPGRFTLLTCLGLSLLAGRGFDRLIPARRFWTGLALAIAFGAAAGAWGHVWSLRPDVRAGLGDAVRTHHLTVAALAWGTAVVALVAWRLGTLGPRGPFALAAVELGCLFYQGPTTWSWPVPLPRSSPVLSLLGARARGRAGRRPAPEHPGARGPDLRLSELRHQPAVAELPDPGAVDAAVAPGPALRALALPVRRDARGLGRPEAVPQRCRGPLRRSRSGARPVAEHRPADAHSAPLAGRARSGRGPPARVALVARAAEDWYRLFPALSKSYVTEEVWFERADLPPERPGPRARSARLLHWDGRSGTVEHDGTCDLVLRRTYVPGWTARLDDGPEVPVLRADGGLQAVRIPGTGRTRVTVRYRPRALASGASLSTVAVAVALGVLAFEARRAWRKK